MCGIPWHGMACCIRTRLVGRLGCCVQALVRRLHFSLSATCAGVVCGWCCRQGFCVMKWMQHAWTVSGLLCKSGQPAWQAGPMPEGPQARMSWQPISSSCSLAAFSCNTVQNKATSSCSNGYSTPTAVAGLGRLCTIPLHAVHAIVHAPSIRMRLALHILFLARPSKLTCG